MLALLPLLIYLIAAGTDVLPICLRILESYLLLDAATVLQVSSCAFVARRAFADPRLTEQLGATDLFMAFEGILGDLELKAVKVILHGLNTIFQTSPIAAWVGALDDSAAFTKLLQPLSDSQTPVLIVTKCERTCDALNGERGVCS